MYGRYAVSIKRVNIYLFLFTAFPCPLNYVEPGELCIADYCQPVPCTATGQCVTDKYVLIIHSLLLSI